MATPQTTVTSQQAWSPDLQAFVPSEIIPDALVLQTSTVAGRIEGDDPAVRAAYVDDAAAEFVAEGSAIPEAEPGLSEVLVHTGKVSQLVRLSREQWVQNGTAAMLSDSVRRAVTKRANEAYIAQPAPTSPAVTPPAGLVNIAGVLDGGAVADDLDALSDAFALIEGNGGTPTNIVAAPDAFGALRKFKTATGSALTLLGAGTQDMDRRLLGVPLLVSAAVPAGSLLVIDKSAVISAVGDVQVAVSEHRYFDSDSIALRCTWRFGANLVRPDRVASLTVTAPA